MVAFARVVNALQIRKIPAHIFIAFKPFLEKFKPCEEHELSDLITLFEFTKAVGDNWEWLSYCIDKEAIIISNPADCILSESGPLAAAFAAEFELYSSSFFSTFDQLMSGAGLQRIMTPYIDDFFGFIKDGKAR